MTPQTPLKTFQSQTSPLRFFPPKIDCIAEHSYHSFLLSSPAERFRLTFLKEAKWREKRRAGKKPGTIKSSLIRVISSGTALISSYKVT